MKRLAPLALIVLALAAVPAALADDGGSAPARPAAAQQLQVLQLRLGLARLRFARNCRGKHSDRCVAFAQRTEERLTKLDANVQAKLDALKDCTSDSTDAACKNADVKVAVLTKLDGRLRQMIANVQSWTAGVSNG